MGDSHTAAAISASAQPMTDRLLRDMVRKIAAQSTGASHRLQHPWIQDRAELKATEHTSVGDISGAMLAAVSRCYLEPAAMILWFLDQALDPKRRGSERASVILRQLAKRAGSLHRLSGDQLDQEIAAAVTADNLQEVLEDPLSWPEG